MSSENLVIVESPAKAKTIEKFLGKDYLVKSSFGHIRDLPKKDIGVDIEHGFAPTYEVSEDKKKIVAELKSLASKVKRVWLASDEDREGEAIAWHLTQVLGLDVATTRRIVFHEITKNAILNAIQEPRTVNLNLVNAQQARRILDRLVGFELSPVLWKKVKPSLSAGRVQSVAVRLIVEREKEIIRFKGARFYKVAALFSFIGSKGEICKLKADLNHKFGTEEEARAFLELCAKARFSVESIEKKPGRRSPAAPFTTSTLQQEASRKLGFSVSRTMMVAQRLYEAGLITYMCTDSVNLSQDAVAAIGNVIKQEFGNEYLHNRQYKVKSKGAQEAHEAIRPSYIDRMSIDGSPQEKRLYDLIWKRAVASQMSDAVLEKTNIDIRVEGSDKLYTAKGEVVKFDGFLKLYSESGSDEEKQADSGLLPPIEKGQELSAESIDATERFEQRPPRYSEASLVKHLEDLGIGRPSTYAPTISTIINRGYVLKEDREGTPRGYVQLSLTKSGEIIRKISEEITGAEKAKLFPTDIGMLVNEYLEKHFPAILDYNFTAKVEKEFDDIAEGKLSWEKMIRHFYEPFHDTVEEATEEKGSFANSQQRLLGTDPESGKNVYARVGRFGAMIQIGESQKDGEGEKPQYASLQSGQLIATITLEEALQLFRLPRNAGEYEGKEITIGVGRFGPYVRHDGKFVSLAKTDNPYTITQERAIELIEEKRKKEREKVIHVYETEGIQVLNGRWGPYIAFNGANYKIPKGTDAASLSVEDCKRIIEAQEAEGENAPSKKAARKAAVKSTKSVKTVKSTAAKKTAARKSSVKKTTKK